MPKVKASDRNVLPLPLLLSTMILHFEERAIEGENFAQYFCLLD